MEIALPLDTFLAFLLAFSRAVAWLMIMPPFHISALPMRAKAGLAAGLALVVAPSLSSPPFPSEIIPLALMVTQQAIIGAAMGLIGAMLFHAVQAAGSIIDMASGLALAQTFDPLSHTQGAVISRFYQLTAVTLLFAVDGHILLIQSFLSSFTLGPTTSGNVGDLAQLATKEFAQFFQIAVGIAVPILGPLLLAEVGLGVLTRAAQQLNIFTVGLPAKILFTFFLLGSALPLLVPAVKNLIIQIAENSATVARLLTP